MQDRDPGYGNFDTFRSPYKQHNQAQAAPGLTTNSHITPHGYNMYAPNINVYIPTLPTQRGHNLGQGMPRKRKANDADEEYALTSAQTSTGPRRKRAKQSNEPMNSVEKAVSQDQSTKRRRDTEGGESGEFPGQNGEDSEAEKPGESKESTKRDSAETKKGTTTLVNGALHWRNPRTGEWGKLQAIDKTHEPDSNVF